MTQNHANCESKSLFTSSESGRKSEKDQRTKNKQKDQRINERKSVTDLGGALTGPKFSQFYAVFGTIWQVRILAPPPPPTKSWRLFLWEILDPPLKIAVYAFAFAQSKHSLTDTYLKFSLLQVYSRSR